MIKYAKVVNEETKLCEVGLGDPLAVFKQDIDPETGELTIYTVGDWYASLGMSEMDIEQGADGNWYLAGFAPPPPETKTVRTFSKFQIWVATRELPIMKEDGTETTVWAAFEDFLLNAGLWTGWLQLVDLVEDNPFFEQFYPLAAEAFGKDLVDGVLAASVTSTKEVAVE
jgi:hypothetical protein